MTEIDAKDLRDRAERARECVANDGIASVNLTGEQIIALLGEIESLKEQLAWMDETDAARRDAWRKQQMNIVSTQFERDGLRSQLSAMTAARDEACNIAEGWSLPDGERARIAELRKVGAQ